MTVRHPQLDWGLNYKVKDSLLQGNDGCKGMTVRHPQLDWGLNYKVKDSRLRENDGCKGMTNAIS
jgi:hypothetical protein